MRWRAVLALWGASLVALNQPCVAAAGYQDQAPRSRAKVFEAVKLSFDEFFEPGPRGLLPSRRLLDLDGKRVRLVGFMARMELLPKGAFFLTPRPVYCDESGGGTADLPPEAVRVVVRSFAGKPIPYTPRLLEVTGVLSVGTRAEPDGTTSGLRLVLDRRGSAVTSPKPTRTPTKEKRRREP
jgi:hypothetical protein